MLQKPILDNCALIASMPVRQVFTPPDAGWARCHCGGPCRAGLRLALIAP
jgi:hypothetical protein